LIDGLKFDLRIYVLLYGINPMKIYVFEDGLARFATTPYE
jgi:tubulin polyglutamylase TTLL6/13